MRTKELHEQRKDTVRYAETENNNETTLRFISKRWILAYLGFFCVWCLYGTRSNLSMSIPCMVKPDFFNVTRQNISNDNSTDVHFCLVFHEQEEADESNKHFEFTWDKGTGSMALAAIYYGYIVTPIPSGMLADRYGGKRVITVSMAVICLLTLLTPLAARLSVETLIGVRILLGAASGPVLCGIYSLWSKWAPRNEATSLQIFTFMGIPIGTCATFFISGYLCKSGIDNGWPSIFYFTGLTTLVWLIPWVFLTADSPRQHSGISKTEIAYIEKNSAYTKRAKIDFATVRAILTSNACWATITAHFCSNWVYYTFMTVLPLYMQEVLNFDIKKNGVLSSLPFVCQCVFALVSSIVADKVKASGKLTTKMTRKLFQSIGSVGTASGLVTVGFISCDNRDYVVVLLCLSLGFWGIQWSGYATNHVDYAPRYAGTIFGISNTLATIPGIASPLITGFTTQHDTQEEWRSIFLISGGISIFGGVIFLLLAEGEVQKWAIGKDQIEKGYDISSANAEIR